MENINVTHFKNVPNESTEITDPFNAATIPDKMNVNDQP